jgi:hypothetical protein
VRERPSVSVWRTRTADPVQLLNQHDLRQRVSESLGVKLSHHLTRFPCQIVFECQQPYGLLLSFQAGRVESHIATSMLPPCNPSFICHRRIDNLLLAMVSRSLSDVPLTWSLV